VVKLNLCLLEAERSHEPDREYLVIFIGRWMVQEVGASGDVHLGGEGSDRLSAGVGMGTFDDLSANHLRPSTSYASR
jgi:hypothetical protein